MPTTAAPKVDLRALLQDRRSKESRPTVRVTLCFNPDLLDQLREAQVEKDIRDHDNRDKPDPDQRMGKRDPLAAEVARLEAEVAASSVVAVFRVPTREKQADYNRMVEEDIDLDPIMVRECFQCFMVNNEPVPEETLGKADLETWLDVASRGEVNDISYRIATRSMGSPDFPASVKRSMATPR